jgi:hypothetical protein
VAAFLKACNTKHFIWQTKIKANLAREIAAARAVTKEKEIRKEVHKAHKISVNRIKEDKEVVRDKEARAVDRTEVTSRMNVTVATRVDKVTREAEEMKETEVRIELLSYFDWQRNSFQRQSLRSPTIVVGFFCQKEKEKE